MRHCTMILLTLAVVLIAALAYGHKVRVFAYSEGDMIRGETSFSGGRPAKNVKIVVENHASKELLLTTRTDEKGFFSFPVPAAATAGQLDMAIIVDGGDGHRNSWLLKAADYLTPDVVAEPKTTDLPAAQVSPVKEPATQEQSNRCSEAQLGIVVNDIVAKQLQPIKRSLAELQTERISPKDIFGGLGYILGLAGIAAYMKSKQGGSKC